MPNRVWPVWFPKNLRRDFKVYCAKEEKKIKNVIDDVLRGYRDEVKAGNRPLVDEYIREISPPDDNWVSWGIIIESDLYKDLKKMSVDADEHLYAMVTSGLYTFMRDNGILGLAD
ncbi:hypothetical protein [Alicyclobacillus mengziensis]|uniref:Uncharacterized protein n=1 Tax=Alicyclobacillus mengziensis TaxID=2931921 RepID=A0A9X7Z8G5_9BACL|nr:hypothetical protein [Alicyclobacillus mengziensis]QSO50134.1 hypothetical protein JZ786_24520 [Alicyclobacillus mengziensis]